MFTNVGLRKLFQVVILTLAFTVQAHEDGISQAAVNAEQTSKSSTSQNQNVKPEQTNFQAATTSHSTIMSADQLPLDETPSKFSIEAQISQSRNLVDFKDGTREDALEITVLPRYATTIGSFSAKIVHTKNIKDDEDITNGFADTLLTYTYPSIDWGWKLPYVLFLNPGFTLGIPTSRISQKQTQLTAATIFNLAMGIRPDNIVSTEHAWIFQISLTAGRNFYPYEEDINGNVLNQYSSNQMLSLSYNYMNWTMAIDLLNRSRWTFQNNIRQSFVSNQEIGYSFNDNLSLSVGHTNEASAMKANAQESNLNFIDEKTSTVFVTMGVSY